MYTQSYFLSATDAAGSPVQWTRILRLEELTSSADFPGVDPSQQAALIKKGKAAENFKPPYEGIINLVRADDDLRCGICRVYRQDFACLGYGGCESCLL